MSKLGDLWVRLGVKTQDLKSGLAEGKSELKKFGSEAEGVFSSFASAASSACLAVAAALMKLGKDALTQTQVMGDAFNRTVEGMKRSYRTLVGMLATGNFKNFFGRLGDSNFYGQKIYEAEDALTEVQNGVRMQKAAMAEELAMYEEQARNQSLSLKEREEAARKYLAAMEPLYAREEAALKRVSVAYMDAFLEGTGLEGSNDKYDYVRSFLEAGGVPGKFSTGDSYKDNKAYLALSRKYGALSNEEIALLNNAINSHLLSKAASFNDNKRMNNLVNSLVAQGAKGNTDEASAALSQFMEEALSGALVDLDFDNETEGWLSLIADPKTEAEKWVDELAEAAAEAEKAFRDSISETPISPVAFDFEAIDKMKEAVDDLSNALRSGLVSALDELAYALGGVEDANPMSVFTALLTPLADTAIQAGIIIMSTGEALEKLKSALANPFGTGAISAAAAGAGLIAVGVMAKAGLVALSRGGSSASGTTSTSAGASTEAYESAMEITVKVEGKISGNDILLSGERAAASLAR